MDGRESFRIPWWLLAKDSQFFGQLIKKITEQYGRLDEKRTMVSRLHNVKACRLLARANATGSSVVCKSQQKAGNNKSAPPTLSRR